MKHCSIITLLLWIMSLGATAQNEKVNYPPSIQKVGNEIFNFLKEEGYMPTNEEGAGLIRFKKESIRYLIYLSNEEESPFFVQFQIQAFDIDSTNVEHVNKLKEYAIIGQSIPGVKIIPRNDAAIFAMEFYFHNAEAFKYVFFKCMKQLEFTRKMFTEAWGENPQDTQKRENTVSASSIPITITKIKVGITDKDRKVISDYGIPIWEKFTQYLTPQIILKAQKTGSCTLYIKLFTPAGLARNDSSPEGYTYSEKININEIDKSLTYNLTGWGSQTKGFWKKGSYRFEIWLDGKMLGSKTFKVL